jgi:hypothetical protein
LSKLAALHALGKHLGLFSEKLDPRLGQHQLKIHLVDYSDDSAQQ